MLSLLEKEIHWKLRKVSSMLIVLNVESPPAEKLTPWIHLSIHPGTLRYTDAMNHDICFDKDVANHWMNVDFYCGGIEHAQMHTIYARFWTKALRLGLTRH